MNISTRSFVGTGAEVQIAGFVIRGSNPKQVLIRGSGPALANLSVVGFLTDPVIAVFDNGANKLLENDDWSGNTLAADAIRSAAKSAGAFEWSEGSKDAAVVATLSPGNYTAQLSGKGGTVGVALIEVYELTEPSTRLVNISSRTSVQSGTRVQIAGFVIRGTGSKRVLLRASGPSLKTLNVPGFLSDPALGLYRGSNRLAENDDWAAGTGIDQIESAVRAVGAFSWERLSKDAALLVDLEPGEYTAIVSGINGATGIALVEVYEVW
jgi:hypothetical protein